jgi:hypothetical protein
MKMANVIQIERQETRAICRRDSEPCLQTVIVDDYRCTTIDLLEDEIKLTPDEYLKFLLELTEDDKEDDADAHCLIETAHDLLTDVKNGFYAYCVDGVSYPANKN